MKFLSDAAVEAYLNPWETISSGCGFHPSSPACLCDVRLSEPTALVKAHPMFVDVKTVEDLLQVAANLWLQLDVLEAKESYYKARPAGDISSNRLDVAALCDRADELRQDILAGVREGDLLAKYKCSQPLLAIVRNALNKSPASPHPVPTELIVQLGDSGLSGREILREVKRRTGFVFDTGTISKSYVRETGRQLVKRYVNSAAPPDESNVEAA